MTQNGVLIIHYMVDEFQAMDRLAVRLGKRRPPVAAEEYEALKWELEEKERALADLNDVI